ncbi:MAG: hypothetical protein ACO31I_07265 [Prochlorotrichaceae cyanobacterium]|jgi:hypothetical protein
MHIPAIFSFALTWPSSTALSFGGSKLFQVLVPLFTFMLLQELRVFKDALIRIIHFFRPQSSWGDCENLVNLLVGFMSWKIGCDLGFLIIATGAAPWTIAFTFAGLVPYTITQYVLYYVFGQKILIEGRLNPFKPQEFVPRSIRSRPPLWKAFISKFFHESMNATSAHVPLRQVFLKPFLDYGCILLTWPLYNVGLIFSQSGELNFAPIVHFTFLSIFTFYVVNVLGYILGYNFGEFLYFQSIFALEWVQRYLRDRQRQEQAQRSPKQIVLSTPEPVPSPIVSKTFGEPVRDFLARYGLNVRWLLSTSFGVMTVITIEPSLSGFIFSNADLIQQFLYHHFGSLDPVHVQQFLAASQPAELPNIAPLIEYFQD